MNRIKKEEKIDKKSKFKIWKIVLLLIFTLIIITAIKTGIYISNWQKMAQDMISNSPSQVLDTDGNVIAELGNTKNTKNISLSEMPDNLKNAYISIEDQRFYSHSGVDLPRTGAAILSYIKNLGSSSFGGSSITQQLVKNLTGDNSSKITRKINEWIKAFGIEGVLEKDEILEAYLNIIYVGPNIYGVELGSKYYFNKSASELTLEECAFLAGINNSPNSYNPFGDKDNSEKITKRTKTVLSKMLELKYINEDDYSTAISKVDEGLKFKNGKIESENSNNIYSYHTDALINEIISDIANKKNISNNFATNYIEMAGLKIYSTQDSKIQTEMEKELSKNKYILKSSNDPEVTSQAAMVIINQSNGYVVGCVGGTGKKETSRGLNRATQSYRQTGSASKPLAVLTPAIDKKIITPASIYLDEATTFDDGTEEGYSPTDYNHYKGEITVREAVESSQNIPFVKIMEQLTPKTSIEYMKKMGITTLTKTDENLNLALGGLDKGISPLEMAAAYATIANDGKYIEPTFYTKIENQVGKTILKTTQKHKNVLSKEVAFILKNLLTEPVTGANGTANYCKISGIDVVAKTGTTNDDFDRWLCGFTPYYTATTWFGFDKNETIKFNNKNPSGQIWSSVMKTIHSGLSSKKFEIPSGNNIETATICPKTGLLAYTSCPNSYTEYFLKGTLPNEYCIQHYNSTSTQSSNIKNTVSNKETQTPISEPVEIQTPTTSEPDNVQINTESSTPFTPEEQTQTREPNTNSQNTTPENTTIVTPTTPDTDNTENTTEDTTQDNLTDIDDTFEQ